MKHLLSTLGTILVASVSFFFIHSESQNIVLAGILAGVVLLYSLVLILGERKLFPEIKADVVLCASVGALLGLSISAFPVSLLNDYGYKSVSIFIAVLFF